MQSLLSNLTRLSIRKSIPISSSSTSSILLSRTKIPFQSTSNLNRTIISSPFSTSSIILATLNQVTRGARKPIRRNPRTPALQGCYQKKGVCSKGRLGYIKKKSLKFKDLK